MTELYFKLKKDMMVAKKERDFDKAKSIGLIIGEIQRSPTKDYSDKTVGQLIKKLYKISTDVNDVALVEILKNYIPEQVSGYDIKKFIISQNWDFTNIKGNARMRYMKNIIDNFGAGSVDGALAKTILLEM